MAIIGVALLRGLFCSDFQVIRALFGSTGDS